MNPDVNIPALSAALILPLLLGLTWVYWLVRRTARHNLFVIVGHGYVVGALMTTLLLKAWAEAGLRFSFWPLAGLCVLLTVAGWAALWRQGDVAASVKATIPSHRSRPAMAAVTLLVALMALRYANLAQEIALRPLFPWDAWMNWAPRAIVWYHYGELVPFVSPYAWLEQSTEGLVYTLGNWQSWHYPPGIPLLELWTMLGAGTDRHTLLQLPWLLLPLAVGLSLYGHLRLAGHSTLVAAACCYAWMNLPYVNVHTALAGYADLWLAAAFGLGVLAGGEWQASRRIGWLALSLLLALACAWFKQPGMVFGAIVLVILAAPVVWSCRAALPTLGLALLAGIAWAALFGIKLDIPLLGELSLTTERITLPGLGSFDLAYHPVQAYFMETFFLSPNWNFLWYLLGVAVLVTLFRGGWRRPPSAELLALLLGGAVLLVVFFFTRLHNAAEDFTTLNRALLYLSLPAVSYVARLVAIVSPATRGAGVGVRERRRSGADPSPAQSRRLEEAGGGAAR